MHVTASVGWLGAVVAFLALAVAGLATGDPQLARGAYLAMDVTAWFVIVPLCFASLATGIVGPSDHRALRAQLVVDSAVAVLVLIVATALAVYKPRGMTRYGRRAERRAEDPTSTSQ